MDIKLKARLSAYSKVSTTCEECDADVISKEQIDELFDPSIDPQPVTKSEIDELFEESDISGEITRVSFDRIDSLFN